MPNNIFKKDFTSKEKKHLMLFGFLGTLTLLLVFFQMSAHLNISNIQIGDTADVLGLDAQADLNSMLAKQTSDIDNDGISDYEEETVYGTSPYLADTDSDGFTDLEEIETGNDPLCPKGQDCATPATITPDATASSSAQTDALDALLQQLGGPGALGAVVDPSASPETDLQQRIVSGTLSSDEIRQMMLAFGMTEQELAGIDDATLQQIYNDTLKQLQAQQ